MRYRCSELAFKDANKAHLTSCCCCHAKRQHMDTATLGMLCSLPAGAHHLEEDPGVHERLGAGIFGDEIAAVLLCQVPAVHTHWIRHAVHDLKCARIVVQYCGAHRRMAPDCHTARSPAVWSIKQGTLPFAQTLRATCRQCRLDGVGLVAAGIPGSLHVVELRPRTWSALLHCAWPALQQQTGAAGSAPHPGLLLLSLGQVHLYGGHLRSAPVSAAAAEGAAVRAVWQWAQTWSLMPSSCSRMATSGQQTCSVRLGAVGPVGSDGQALTAAIRCASGDEGVRLGVDHLLIFCLRHWVHSVWPDLTALLSDVELVCSSALRWTEERTADEGRNGVSDGCNGVIRHNSVCSAMSWRNTCGTPTLRGGGTASSHCCTECIRPCSAPHGYWPPARCWRAY